MAVKTITIDMEAYETLSRHKRPGQSFSQVIKEHFRGRGLTGADLMKWAGDGPASEAYLDTMDRIIEERELDPSRLPGS